MPLYLVGNIALLGAILVDLDRVERRQLLELLTDAWLIKAPARLRPSLGERRGRTH